MKNKILTSILIILLLSAGLYAVVLMKSRPKTSPVMDLISEYAFRKIDFSVLPYKSTVKQFSLTTSYVVDTGCSECLANFLKRDLGRKGWRVAQKNMDQLFLKLISNLKSGVDQNKGGGTGLTNLDEKTAQYLKTTDYETINKEVEKAAPVIIEATRLADGMRCLISIVSVADSGKSIVTVNLEIA